MTPYEQQAERLAAFFIKGLQEGKSRLTQRWEGQGALHVPHNPTTGKPYRGGNALMLECRQIEIAEAGGDSTDARWMTYRQAVSVGAQVRKGERSTPLVCWVDRSKPGGSAELEPTLDSGRNRKLLAMSFCVFHSSQIDGLPRSTLPPELPLDDRIKAALALVEQTGAEIRYGGDRAYYSPREDFIAMPHRAAFTDQQGAWMATELHELGHWSGHHTRLNRPFGREAGGEGWRAREELRAEMASCLMSDRLGVPFDPGEHQAYVNSWILDLSSDPKEIMRAAADAERISRFLGVPELEFQKLPQIEREQEMEQEQEVALDLAR